MEGKAVVDCWKSDKVVRHDNVSEVAHLAYLCPANLRNSHSDTPPSPIHTVHEKQKCPQCTIVFISSMILENIPFSSYK